MKLIVVDGPKSSGKTGSIKLAVKMLGADFSNSPVADIQCITRIRVGVSNKLIGIGSAGDTADAIRANLLFFKDHDLDFAICACSAPNRGMPLLKAFALLHGAEIVPISTRHVPVPQIGSENRACADKITRAINGK
jgi:hypothetical protein